jgi:dihydroorotate dehydrogenase (NAD+) catalytic subunit
MKKILSTRIGQIEIETPLLTTSGTSGSSDELSRLKGSNRILKSLGAFVTKGVTLKKRLGNLEPRVVETRSGIINSIGLQNSGAEVFINNELPHLGNYQIPIIVNISASTIDEFGELAKYLSYADSNRYISGLEINVSCPNIKEGGAAFGSNPKIINRVVRTVKDNVPNWITIITKLSPNVTSISDCGKAAIDGGTDALSMINTLRAMAIDIEHKRPLLGNKTGGLSGPAIKPIGVYMVYECFRDIIECKEKKIKIIGIGGISNWRDALEYILAGASAIGIGTEWFINNQVFTQVENGIKQYLSTHGESLEMIVGKANEK